MKEMKTGFQSESEKVSIKLDQAQTEPSPGSQENLNILNLVNKPQDYNVTEDNYSGIIAIEVNKDERDKTQKSDNLLEGQHGKDWNLKNVPDIYQSDKLSNFSCSKFRCKEKELNEDDDDDDDDDVHKSKKKAKSRILNSINMEGTYHKEDLSSHEVFLPKLMKAKNSGSRGRKCCSKGKEKSGGFKRGYKPIAPYPPNSEQKITVLPNPIQKIMSPQVNPILIVKIDDQGASDDKQKIPEYLNSTNEKKFEESDCVLSCDFHNLPDETRMDLIKNKKNYVTKTKCYKCCDCSFMTLNIDYLNYHYQKKPKCCVNDDVFHCPGCKNIFYSLTPLRVHLVHDHKLLSKEVKEILQNIQESRLEFDREKSSCTFQSNQSMTPLNGTMFGANMNNIEMLTEIETRENIDKNYDNVSNRHIPETRDLESCSNEKRQTMLESYLDDINSKGDCNLPPTLNHNGSALLENTFNFTAPVSEQLPSIQPPPAHSASNPLLDQSHLMVEHQNHGFIGMANVFDARDQGAYKINDSSHYREETNLMMSNSNYLPSHIQDIPVINLDENNLEKSSQSILSNDINIEDFSNYQETEPGPLEPSTCPMPAEEEVQEEKKKLKKLGVGFRCDINGCKVRLQSEKNIQYHRRCHEGTLYNCPECCKDCSTWVSLSSHLWQAHKIDMELYKCDQCPYKTPSYSRLTNIHRGIHGKARPFLCDICGKGFKTVKQMRNHKNIHKAKMVRMSVCHCEICGRTVADKRQLELHINNTHKKKKPYLCYMCGYASAVKHSLVVHMRRHTGEKPYQCEKCEYKTADHNALRRHKMKHSGVRSYKCSHCTYTCIQASTYKVHIKTKHPGLEADVIFSCGQCNFQTLNRGSYLSHTSEHGNFNGQMRKPNQRCTSSKSDGENNSDYFGEPNRMDLVGPIISERVVETIVDLSGAHTLLEQDDYYNVERITGDLDEGQELKFKTSGIT